jgi:hypothetical protein
VTHALFEVLLYLYKQQRDLSSLEAGKPLQSAGSINAHTRPVEALAARTLTATTAVLYTADTMGLTKAWELEKEDGSSPRWRTSHKLDLKHHRTRINEIAYGNGQLWSGLLHAILNFALCYDFD